MRIWSLHPSYLDAKGLVALWRETLLAKHVLLGKTKGYKNHPQLNRFKACKDPVSAIDQYLLFVFEEASARGYSFDKKKIDPIKKKTTIPVKAGQIKFEWQHLERKLKVRDKNKLAELKKVKSIKLHPIFKKVKGGIEDWEIT